MRPFHLPGRVYRLEDLPAGSQKDVLDQWEDIELRFGRDPRSLLFRFIVIPNWELRQAVNAYFGDNTASLLRSQPIRSLMSSITKEGGLDYPPVGDAGWDRALAMAQLGMDMPYFIVDEPLEIPVPSPLPPMLSLEGAKEEAETIPPEMARSMREGFWRMMQRIHFGIPGFKGSGEIQGDPGSQHFNGGLAGVRTAWPLRPHSTSLFETPPLAGFYSWGMYWPKILQSVGLARGKHDNFSKMVERLEKEFGRALEYDLMKGTVPFPQEGASMGSTGTPSARIKPWVRCGNTLFWTFTGIPEVEPIRRIHLNPFDLVEISVTELQAVPEGAILLVRRRLPEEQPEGWTPQDFHRALEKVPGLLSDAIATWLAFMGEREAVGIPRTEIIATFIRMGSGRRNTILSGLEQLFKADALQTLDDRRLVVAEGSSAHQALFDLEAGAEVTDSSLIVPSLDVDAVVDEVLSSYGVVEC